MEEQNKILATLVERVANLQCTIENNHEEYKEDIMENNAYHKLSNGRLKKLEVWRAYLLGAWVVITFVSTFVMPALGYYFLKTFRYEMRQERLADIQNLINENNNKFFELDEKD